MSSQDGRGVAGRPGGHRSTEDCAFVRPPGQVPPEAVRIAEFDGWAARAEDLGLTLQPAKLFAFDSKTRAMVIELMDAFAAGIPGREEWQRAVDSANAAQRGYA